MYKTNGLTNQNWFEDVVAMKFFNHVNAVSNKSTQCRLILSPTLNEHVGLPEDFLIPCVRYYDNWPYNEFQGRACQFEDYYGIEIPYKLDGTILCIAQFARIVIHEARHIYQYLNWHNFNWRNSKELPWDQRKQEIDAISFENVEDWKLRTIREEVIDCIDF